jgi:O-antigen ligase
LALLPPAAIFLLVCNLSSTWRKRLCWILLLAAAASIFLSAFQLFGGERSPLRFYQVTNPNRPVGFFASANHLPTLVLCALPFLGWLAADAMSSSRAQKRSSGLTMALSLAGFLVAGILASGSMAGYALLVPAALATFLIYRRAVAKRVGLPWAILVGLLSVGFIVAAASAPLGQRVVNDKFSEHPTSRGVIWQNTAEAVRAFAPMGSGLGTFVPVYRTFDNPDRASRVYVNHAHNDYLEFLLELGAAGAMLVLAFLFWWARKGVRAWADEYQGAGMARIGSIVTGLILLHSTVDYPLRTAAMAAVFALAAGLMVPPPASARHRRTSKEQELTGGLRHVGID